MKIYELVLQIMETRPETRNSDKLLIWEVLRQTGRVKTIEYFGPRQAILKENFLSGKLIPFESITRARRKVQELHPDLGATSVSVKNRRSQKEKLGGSIPFHERVNMEAFAK